MVNSNPMTRSDTVEKPDNPVDKRRRKRKPAAVCNDHQTTGVGDKADAVNNPAKKSTNHTKNQKRCVERLVSHRSKVKATANCCAESQLGTSSGSQLGNTGKILSDLNSDDGSPVKSETLDPDAVSSNQQQSFKICSSNVRETRCAQTDLSGIQVHDLISAAESSARVPIFARPFSTSVASSRTEPVASLYESSVANWRNSSTSSTSSALLSSANAITQSLDSRIETLRCESVRLKSEKEQLGREVARHDASQPEAVKLLQELLLQKSDIEKEQLREKCSLNKYRLGEFKYVRQGSALVEQLTEGVDFVKLRKRRSDIATELNEAEKRRRVIAKMSRDRQKQQQASTCESTPNLATCSLEELVERDEILKLRTASLRKEDAELQRELERLSCDRLVHSKQLKRIEAEDASHFTSTLERPRVLNDRYLILDLIGKGGFSEVHRAYDLLSMRYVACKIHEHSAAWSREHRDSYVRHVVREIEIQKTLCHPHIVSIYDAFDIDANALCTVLEYVHGHDLDFHLRQHQMIAEREARAIVLQVVAALVYLNEQNPAIIHYDLKPANILLSLEPQAQTNTFSIKITDFGLAKLVHRRANRNDVDDADIDTASDATSASGTELTSQGVGTYWYLPPECFFGIGPNAFTPVDEVDFPQSSVRISNKVDVWSLGVVFYNMVYGCKPFGHGISQQEILRTNLIVATGREVTFPAKPHVSLDARSFIKRCLTYEKELRPNVFAIAKDSYLQRGFTSRKRNVASRKSVKDTQTAGCSSARSVNNVQRVGNANADDAELQEERDETAAGESDDQDVEDERDDGETA